MKQTHDIETGHCLECGAYATLHRLGCPNDGLKTIQYATCETCSLRAPHHHFDCPTLGAAEDLAAASPDYLARPDANPKSVFGMTKPPLHLVPSTALVRTAMVMKLGAQKYGAYNWRDQPVAATVYVSAAERHLRAWLDGEDADPESGQSHLAHMVACGMILLDAMEIPGGLVDDRPTAAPTGALITALIEKKAVS